MKKAKIWKKRIFASLVAVCMVFTLLPATAAAAEGTEETPAQLVKGVMAAQPNPATMANKPEKELSHYQKNMGMISRVHYAPDSGTITVTADRSGMEPYNITSGPGWGTYYALVMNFDSSMKLQTDTETMHNVNIKAVDGYEINESYNEETNQWDGRDISDAKEFLPGYAAAEYNNPIVFWLNARDDRRPFTLKYTDPDTGTVTKQDIVVEIKDTSKLVDQVVVADPDAEVVENKTEKAYYKKNMGSISEAKLENGTITVTAKRNGMESYYRGSSPEKKKWYALVLDFKNLDETVQGIVQDSENRIGKNFIEADTTYTIMPVDRNGDSYKKQNPPVPDPPNDTGDTASQAMAKSEDRESIVFWLDAETNTRDITLCREIVEKAEQATAQDEQNGNSSGQPSTDSNEMESANVVSKATQTIRINVEDDPTSIEPTIILNKTEATIKKGDTVELEATTTPDGVDVTWESDDADESVVMVSQTGKVAGIGKGEATITAKVTTVGGIKEATCDITVTDNGSSDTGGPAPGVSGGSNGPNGSLLPQNADIALNQDTALIYAKAKKQNTVQLKAVVVGNSKKVTWRSLNPRIATVKNGKVTAKKAGKATITATANGLTAKCIVTVKNPTIKLAKAKATIKKGKKVRINATATPASKITYKSNKKRVATVTAKGVVKGKKKGTAKITVTANGVKKTFTVRVK